MPYKREHPLDPRNHVHIRHFQICRIISKTTDENKPTWKHSHISKLGPTWSVEWEEQTLLSQRKHRPGAVSSPQTSSLILASPVAMSHQNPKTLHSIQLSEHHAWEWWSHLGTLPQPPFPLSSPTPQTGSPAMKGGSRYAVHSRFLHPIKRRRFGWWKWCLLDHRCIKIIRECLLKLSFFFFFYPLIFIFIFQFKP